MVRKQGSRTECQGIGKKPKPMFARIFTAGDSPRRPLIGHNVRGFRRVPGLSVDTWMQAE